jgi:hypothetical protein
VTAAVAPLSLDRPALPEERAAFEDAARERRSATGVEPLPYVWASAVNKAHNPDEIVEGLLTRGTMSAVFGESGCGKTHLAVDLAGHVAQGIPWLGRRSRAGVVIYIAAEAGQSIRNRFKAFKDHHGVEDLRVALVTVPVDLLNPFADSDRVIALARQIEKEFGEPVTLIIIDTLSRAMQGGDENSGEVMGTLVANGDNVRHATGAHMLWVHHSGKDRTKGLRGWSGLLGALDTEIEVTNDSGLVTAIVTKQRDGVAGAELVARLHPVSVGMDSWGNELTACVLEPSAAAEPSTKKKPAKLPKGSQIALKALRETISDCGETMPGTGSIPPGVRAVTGAQWRQRYYALDSLDVDSDDPKETGKARDARKTRFGRAREALQAGEFIGAVNDLFWINP